MFIYQSDSRTNKNKTTKTNKSERKKYKNI